MNSFTEGWYVIYTRPRHERKVEEKLTASEIACFLPLVKKLRDWHDRRKYIEVPLFPSYVFVYLKTKVQYFSVLDTGGVWYFVRSGREVARVSEKIISDLQVIIGGESEVEVTHETFRPGHRLTISKGPLCGLSCEVVEYKGRKELLVRVNLLKRNILVAISSEYLMQVPA